MNELDGKVKHHLSMLGFLINARTLRKESCLPYFDLSLRIWWHNRKAYQFNLELDAEEYFSSIKNKDEVHHG